MWQILLAGAALLVLIEVGARAAGLGRPLLYEKMPYGYRVVPGQSLTRFGNRIHYNEQGLRSETLAAAGTLRVLCIGDSITFGGTETDQRRTYPYLLQEMLNAARGGRRYEVLNASAGGWATENEEGWLRHHGLFQSGVVVLQVASHDLFQAWSGGEVVGSHPSFPDRAPVLAIGELLSRYLLPRLLARREPGEVIYQRTREDIARNLASVERIAALVRGQSAELVVLLVEQPKGIEPEDELTRSAKEELRARLASLHVPLLSPAAAIERQGGAELFRDGLHPNPRGNRVLAETAASAVLTAARAGSDPVAEAASVPRAAAR